MKSISLPRLRWLFLLLFGLTGLPLGMVLLRLSDPRYTGVIIVPGQAPTGPSPLPPAERLTLTISLISTLISAIGFISTTLLAWRKEAREREQALLERERRLLELEKLRRELGVAAPTVAPASGVDSPDRQGQAKSVDSQSR